MKIAIIGGHFSPALALIEELAGKAEVFVMGRKYAMEGDTALSFEYRLCQEKGIPFIPITSGRLQRRITQYTLSSILKLPIGFMQAYKALDSAKPDIIVSFGGYLSIPIVLCAKILRIPVVLHEQTQAAGLSNRFLAHMVNKICISLESSRPFFPPKKTVFTGNPLRKEIFEIKDVIHIPKGKLIYVTGGSAGSHFINQAIKEAIPVLLKDFVVLHQTGESIHHSDFEELESFRKNLPKHLSNRYVLRKYINLSEIGWVLKEASLIIARAGINTVFELLALGKISLLIPLTHGQRHEQENNAKMIKSIGMGEYLRQENITNRVLVDKIYSIDKNREEYLKNKERAASYIVTDASKRLTHVIQSVYDKEAASAKKKSDS